MVLLFQGRVFNLRKMGDKTLASLEEEVSGALEKAEGDAEQKKLLDALRDLHDEFTYRRNRKTRKQDALEARIAKMSPEELLQLEEARTERVSMQAELALIKQEQKEQNILRSKSRDRWLLLHYREHLALLLGKAEEEAFYLDVASKFNEDVDSPASDVTDPTMLTPSG